MAKTFLRSGNLDALLALGENGQPVWSSALQIRETLRLRGHHALAECLAIPQANERGDRLDWYAPFQGKVKSWLAGSDHERRDALALLTLNQEDLHALSLRARDADNPAMRLFGALLGKTLQFPDQQYVYLVNGKPVITFWGFVDPQARTRDDALACLRDTLEDALPPLLAEPPAPLPAPISVAPIIAPLIEIPPATAAPVPEPQPDPEPVPETPEPEAPPTEPEPLAQPSAAPARRAARPLLLLLPVAAAVAAGVAWWLHQATVSAPQSAEVASSAPAAQQSAPARAVALPPVSKLAATLPQKPASVVATATAATAAVAPPAAPVAIVAEHTEPAKADDLVMTADDARIGSVKFINGTWRVVLRQTNLPTGKPPSLRYQLRNGKGTAMITQGDNIRCKADVTAAMTVEGTMVVRSRYTATCSDKSRYRMPELVCKAGDGIASCTAQYGADQVFPLTIKRESK
ncbi:SrfA family protein [Pantoea eucrina]|uniref:SrfA family protein n=1 Tax=Pantoea eucrina TaxID=472693 RepID=A0ABU5LEV3_9GAMM|nr:SrfA family protein [Pantoea eucrina]MDZ7278476.1 SrfA family protein [Pantoea eucrina]